MEELQEKREGENAFEELERNAAKYCANWKIPATENKRRKKLPQWLKNNVVTGKGIATEQAESSFRIDIFLPILDCLLLELKRRFNSETSIIVLGVQSLKPGSKGFLDMTAIQSVGKLFHCNSEFLKYAVHQLKRLLQHMNLSLSSMRELEVFVHPYHEAFPEIHKLLRIFMTVPVTTAQAERIFSKLHVVKTYLRSRMSSQRLRNLAILLIEQHRSNCLNMDLLVDEFAAVHSNSRIKLYQRKPVIKLFCSCRIFA